MLFINHFQELEYPIKAILTDVEYELIFLNWKNIMKQHNSFISNIVDFQSIQVILTNLV